MRGEENMSNGGGRSGLSSSSGDREHFGHATTDDHVQTWEMSHDEKVAWMESLGFTKETAEELVEAVDEYTGGDYWSIHNGQNAEYVKKIDTFLNNKNAPVFTGTLFRGMVIEGKNGRSGEEILHDILKTGRWSEPGITSFSSDRIAAESFMRDFSKNKANNIPVILRNTRNRSGVPIAHLSKIEREYEVITPSSISRRGFKITGFKPIKNWWDGSKGYIIDIQEN